MPPKVKITKETILNEALNMIKEEGLQSINARDLARRLNCSVQPIFRSYQSMDNLKKELYQTIEIICDKHMKEGMMKHQIPFLGIGLAYIDFAKTEKNYFKFLFMDDGFKGINLMEMISSDVNQEIVQIISSMTQLNIKQSKQLFLSIWLMTHGIASLIATNDCDLGDEEIEKLLMDSFSGMKLQLRKEESNDE